MSRLIEVYIKSVSLSRGLEPALFAGQHVARVPDLLRQHANPEGRFLEASSVDLLTRLNAVAKPSGTLVRLYDLGQPGGWLKAKAIGIGEAPALVMDGRKYIGLVEAKEALSTLDRSDPADSLGG